VSQMDRRDLLRLLAAAPLPAILGVSPATLERAVRVARQAPQAPYQPKFFTAEEWETVRILADLIIPRDERSGSATEAGVPEFMDFILSESTNQQTPIRGGLAWLDRECRERWSRPFRALGDTERTAILDEIAWPARAKPEMSHGVQFFNRFRDMVAAGFWSSKMGVQDLGYQGNTFVTAWTGCPAEQLGKLGVRND
jgi:gluconate 2-dehydrogenase gamma chain